MKNFTETLDPISRNLLGFAARFRRDPMRGSRVRHD